MKDQNILPSISRRRFGRKVATLAGAGAIGTSALCLGTSSLVADDQKRRSDDHDQEHSHDHKKKGYFNVSRLPFHLQHEFPHAISCNNVIAKAVDVQIADGHKKQHAILQRPGTFGWGTITFFLQLNENLVGQDMTFFTNVGWSARRGGHDDHVHAGKSGSSGRAALDRALGRNKGGRDASHDDHSGGAGHGNRGRGDGEVVFSVDINGDIVVDGGRSSKGNWAKVQRTLRVNSHEMRVTLMLDSIRGNNNFDFWWGEPQLIAGGANKQGHDHKH